MEIQLIALDIDGTLTNDRKEITHATQDCLIRAEREGTRLVLASARPLPGLFAIRDQLEMQRYGGILMAYNGGKITDCRGNILSEISMEIEKTREILRALEDLPVTVILDDGTRFYVSDRDGYKVEYECRNNRMICEEVGNLADFLRFAPVKILLAAVPEKIREVQKQIAAFLPKELIVVRTAAFYLEIVPRAINKGKALAEICRLVGVDPESTVAFGDSENDIPMLQAAGVGIAMGNAEESVRKAADWITLGNNEDGIAYAIRKFTKDIRK